MFQEMDPFCMALSVPSGFTWFHTTTSSHRAHDVKSLRPPLSTTCTCKELGVVGLNKTHNKNVQRSLFCLVCSGRGSLLGDLGELDESAMQKNLTPKRPEVPEINRPQVSVFLKHRWCGESSPKTLACDTLTSVPRNQLLASKSTHAGGSWSEIRCISFQTKRPPLNG